MKYHVPFLEYAACIALAYCIIMPLIPFTGNREMKKVMALTQEAYEKCYGIECPRVQHVISLYESIVFRELETRIKNGTWPS